MAPEKGDRTIYWKKNSSVPFLLVVAALAFLNLLNLVGAGYSRAANRLLDRPESPAALAASDIAARYPSWSSTHVALRGWVLAENGKTEEAEAAYRKALRLAPGDPLLWAEYALALGRLGQFDARLTTAVSQAAALAPNSPAVQRSLAELGVSYWARGTPEQRELWLAAMRNQLARNRGEFLGHVLTRGRGQAFCDDAAHALGEDTWCSSMAGVLQADGCFRLLSSQPVPCSPNR